MIVRSVIIYKIITNEKGFELSVPLGKGGGCQFVVDLGDNI